MENHCHLERAVLLLDRMENRYHLVKVAHQLDRMENRYHLVKAVHQLDRMGNHYHLERLVLVALEILVLVVQADPEIWVVLADHRLNKKKLQEKHLKQH